MDMGYDTGAIHDGFEARCCRPVVPLKHTSGVKRGDHLAPTCQHGIWTFAGTDFNRGASKWRCPTGVQARLRLAEGIPPPPADPAREQAVRRPLPGAPALSSARSVV